MARIRAPTTARSLGAICGIASSSISLKSWRSSTSSFSGVVAVTVATRSPPSISAISPKNPPRPDGADLVAVDCGRRVAVDDHEELDALVALHGELGADLGFLRAAASAAMRPSSSSSQVLNSQMPRRSRIRSSRSAPKLTDAKCRPCVPAHRTSAAPATVPTTSTRPTTDRGEAGEHVGGRVAGRIR